MYGLCGVVEHAKHEIASALADDKKVAVSSLQCSRDDLLREIIDADSEDILEPLARIELYNEALDALEELYGRARSEYIATYTPVDLLCELMYDLMIYPTFGDDEGVLVEYSLFYARCFSTLNRYFELVVLVQPTLLEFSLELDITNSLMRGLLTEEVDVAVLKIKRGFDDPIKRIMSVGEAIFQARSESRVKRDSFGIALH